MRTLAVAGLAGVLALGASAGAAARVTRIVIDEVLPFTEPAGRPSQKVVYEQVAGRAFGELDPTLPGKAIIQDIERGRDADGKARYVATFLIIKPRDMRQASGMLWHDAPNRGRVFPMASQERAFHKDQICNYAGGMIPFARTAADRMARGDPRPSLEERYGSHAGYVEAVKRAASRAVAADFLLPVDAEGLIRAAEASKVLR